MKLKKICKIENYSVFFIFSVWRVEFNIIPHFGYNCRFAIFGKIVCAIMHDTRIIITDIRKRRFRVAVPSELKFLTHFNIFPMNVNEFIAIVNLMHVIKSKCFAVKMNRKFITQMIWTAKLIALPCRNSCMMDALTKHPSSIRLFCKFNICFPCWNPTSE